MAKTRFNRDIGSDLPRLSSYAQKSKNDFQLQKDRMDRMDLWYGEYRNHDEIKKFRINYDLFNGRLDTSLYDDPICFNIGSEKIRMGHQTINHHPVTSTVAHAMWGEMINRPFNPVAKHLGATAQTYKRKKRNELIREMLTNRAINPMREQITRRYLEQLRVSDPRMLTPEQIQQVQSDVNNRLKAATPKEILDFMENDFQTPTEKQGQRLLDYLLEHLDLRYLQNEGFKHGIITGREIYYVGDRHGEVTVDLLKPEYFTYSGSDETEWFSEMDWGKYERWLSFEKAVQKYTEELTKNDYEKLAMYAEPYGGFHRGDWYKKDGVVQRTMYELSVHGDHYERKYGNLDIRTKEGMNKMTNIYRDVMQKYGSEYGTSYGDYGVREVSFAWRDKRKLKKVMRIVDNKKEYYWLDEHYEPTARDLEVNEVWIDEVWEGVKLGTGEDCLYLNVRPVPAQFKSIFNPYDVELPFYGRNYSTHLNSTAPVAPLDTAKVWQLEFDTTMAQLKHDMATDVGKVFVLLMNMKPDNMKWQEWLDTMKNSKLLLAAANKHGMSNIDPQIMRAIDLGRTEDIAAKIQLLEFIRQNLMRSMYFNDARLGSIGQYSNAVNTQVNQSASYNQTEGFYETHRKIVEKLLNGVMNRAKHVYRDNSEKIAIIMDDVEAADFELSQNFWYQELGIYFSTSTEDIRKVEELRQQTMAFIQNGMSYEGVFKLVMAKTPTDIMSIFSAETKRIEAQQQQALQQAAEKDEKDRQAKLEEVRIKEEAENQRKGMDATIKRYQADQSIDQFRAQADADQDGRADSLERTDMQLEFERERHRDLMKQQEEDRKLKREELEIKRLDIEKKSTNSK